MNGVALESPGLGALINRMSRGDEIAGAEVFVRMREPLARFFVRLGGSAETSEDLVQATFLKLLSGRERSGPEIVSTSYLYRVALNEWRTAARRSARHRAGMEALERERPIRDAPRPSLEAREACRRALEAIERLPTEQREVLVLHRFEGLSCREIAAVVDCPPKTAESRLRLALEKLLDRMGSWEDDIEPR